MAVAESVEQQADSFVRLTHKLLIDGDWVEAASGQTFETINPAAAEVLAETERRQVRHAFSRYLAPAVVEHLAEHPERLTLGGELRELTIMFSDIEDCGVRYGADLTEVEIAHVLGWPVGTVKSRLNRARERLRVLLSDGGS